MLARVCCKPTPPAPPDTHAEQVLIAQERMANNHVYVFRKSQPSKYAYVGECRCAAGRGRGGAARSARLGFPCRPCLTTRCLPPSLPPCLLARSVVEGSTRTVSGMQVKMLSRAGMQKGTGQCIRANIPYIKADIPILIVFRALGFVVSARGLACAHIPPRPDAAVLGAWAASLPACTLPALSHARSLACTALHSPPTPPPYPP